MLSRTRSVRPTFSSPTFKSASCSGSAVRPRHSFAQCMVTFNIVQRPLHTFPRDFRIDREVANLLPIVGNMSLNWETTRHNGHNCGLLQRQLVTDMLRICYGEATDGETGGVMDGLYSNFGDRCFATASGHPCRTAFQVPTGLRQTDIAYEWFERLIAKELLVRTLRSRRVVTVSLTCLSKFSDLLY